MSTFAQDRRGKMKLIPFFFCAFLLTLNPSECNATGWFPNLLDTVSHKTTQITTYVKDTGRSLQHFYNTNIVTRVKNTFNDVTMQSYYPENEDVTKTPFSTPQLIALHGYQSESHTVVTDDGYILTVHRIPYSRNTTSRKSPTKTVLLHHGLLGSSADWVIPGPGKGLAYILSDAGYDVWLANVRGNTYSRAHVTLSQDSAEFWNFTFHEVSQHDLPAVIDYITALKGVKINYIGHSMGTTVLFALLSTKPEYNKILNAGFALAPVAYMSDIRSPINLLASYADDLAYLIKLLGVKSFLPQSFILDWLSKHMCELNHYEEYICENSLFVLCGFDKKQFNSTLMPLILSHVPAGASTKTLIHYAQEIEHGGSFEQFDYGQQGNLLQYGTPKPPKYAVDNITLPIALLSSKNDWLASEKDVDILYSKLQNPIEHYVVPLKEFNHVDFLWAIDAPKLVFEKLLQLLQKTEEEVRPSLTIDLNETKTAQFIDDNVL